MASIQGIYVALFGRPADPEGLAYFEGVIRNGADLTAIANLSGQPEYLDRFTGMTNDQVVNSIYQALFGRDGEPEGLDFWVGKLASQALTINSIAIAILDSAQGTDRQTADARIAAADLFTGALDTPAKIAAYSGIAATAEIRAYLQKVSFDHPGTLAEIGGLVGDLLPPAPSGPSGPFFGEFTTGTDTLATSIGSHVYTATLSTDATLTADDSLHGNGNTLAITDTDAASRDLLPTGLSLTGVRTVTLTTAGNAGADAAHPFDLSGFADITRFTLDASGANGDFVKVGAEAWP